MAEELPIYVIDGDVYNTAVLLSLEMGGNWRQPIQERLRRYFPGISEEEADQLNGHCREMMDFSIRLAEKLHFEHSCSREQATQLIKQEYPKLEEKNLTSLFAQAEWCALK